MKHTITITKNGVLKLIVNGDLSGSELDEILAAFESYADQQAAKGRPASIIVETTKLGRAKPENRKEALRRLKALKINKMAVYGSHNPYAKYVTRLAAKAIGLPGMRFFDSREEAENWVGSNE